MSVKKGMDPPLRTQHAARQCIYPPEEFLGGLQRNHGVGGREWESWCWFGASLNTRCIGRTFYRERRGDIFFETSVWGGRGRWHRSALRAVFCEPAMKCASPASFRAENTRSLNCHSSCCHDGHLHRINAKHTLSADDWDEGKRAVHSC